MRLSITARAFLAQVAALALGCGIVVGAAALDSRIPWAAAVILVSILASLLSWGLGLPLWWLPIQAVFVPGLIWVHSLDLPPGYFLGGLILLALVYPSNARERVPLFLTNRRTWDAVNALLPDDEPFSFVDLGCGVGGGLVHLSALHPRSRFVGVETAPIPFVIAWLRCWRRANCEVRLQSLWRVDLSAYDAVYAFLSPAPMPRLWEKVRRELHPGALFISNSFPVPGVEPASVAEVDDGRRTVLLIWRM